MSLKYYTDPIEVYNKVVKLWKNTVVNKNDVFEECIDVETNYIKDGDLLAHCEAFPLVANKTTGLANSPCNMIRVIEIYDENDNDIKYSITGSNKIKLVGDYQKAYINYLGTKVNDEGIPVIHQGHVNAMVTFCIMKRLEEQMLLGNVPMGLHDKYEKKFSNQITHIKQSAQYKDKQHYDNVNIIRFNMLKKVGQKRLTKNMFG